MVRLLRSVPPFRTSQPASYRSADTGLPLVICGATGATAVSSIRLASGRPIGARCGDGPMAASVN